MTGCVTFYTSIIGLDAGIGLNIHVRNGSDRSSPSSVERLRSTPRYARPPTQSTRLHNQYAGASRLLVHDGVHADDQQRPLPYGDRRAGHLRRG